MRYLCCPVCGKHMNRRNFARASGVVIDWCRGHGYWFDAHELETILEFVARGGLRAPPRPPPDPRGEPRIATRRAGGSHFDLSGTTGTSVVELLVDVLFGLFDGN